MNLWQFFHIYCLILSTDANKCSGSLEVTYALWLFCCIQNTALVVFFFFSLLNKYSDYSTKNGHCELLLGSSPN